MQGSLMGRRLDLLQLSRHHVFSDMILTQLPPEAVCRLQATCTRLQSHIKDLPEAIWLQAAHSQLPALHPVFSTPQTVLEYLRLHHDIHKAFTPSQTPAALAQVSLSWNKRMTLSPDLSKAVHVKGQKVILTDLTTKQTLGVWLLSSDPQNSKWDNIDYGYLHFSPSGKQIFIDMCGARVISLQSRTHAMCYFVDTEAGTVTAPQGPSFGFWFYSWAPDGQHIFLVHHRPDPGPGLTWASIYDTSCRCTAQAQLSWGPGARHSAWAPDSTAVFLNHFTLKGPQLWNLSGEFVGVKQGVWPPQASVHEIHWCPDSSLLYCTTTQTKQLLCYDRQACLVQSCMLSASDVNICLGLSAQPRVGAATAAIVNHSNFSYPDSDITVYTIGPGCSPAALFSVPLPVNGTSSYFCLSPDGTYLAFILRCHDPDFDEDDGPDDTHALHVCSIRTSIIRVVELHFMPRSLSWAADGAALLVPGYGQGLICRLG